MAAPLSADRSLVIGYLGLRRAIGVLGMALPFVLAIGARILFATPLQSSISHYYHTGMGDVFVGTMCAVGVFLIMYRGYGPTDDRAATRAGICAVGVALFPTAAADPPEPGGVIGILHLVFTALFFLHLIYFAGWLFTKTDPTRTPTRRKLQRNRVYKTCTVVMSVCLVFILGYMLIPRGLAGVLDKFRPVFWAEATAIFFFGVSWLVKGEAILKDDDFEATGPA